MNVRQFLERTFSDHSVGEKLREDAEDTLFRGRRLEDGQAVLFLTSASEHPTVEWLARLEREHALRDDLELPWAARPLSLVRSSGRRVLLLADPGGRPLDTFPSGGFSVAESLRLAHGVAMCLSRVHAKGLVHGDIKPANILADTSTGAAALLGFGIARSSALEPRELGRAEAIVGTPAYMSPEQTGRMNRPVDARGDLYSLGVVLYETLTGRLPFVAADTAELLHSHLAKQPVPPMELDAGIPAVVSDLLMKLLAKSPEERYQTAWGLAADLERGLAEWEARARIDAFPLAREDIPDRLLPLEKLYGRDAEAAQLQAAWQRVASGRGTELILVSGLPGAGKSSLVNALHGEVARGRGLFAVGKFDEQKQNIPYASLTQAFQHLVRQLLVEPEEEIARWRSELAAAVHPNGRVLTDIFPDLELLLGPQPAVPELSPREARNRFLITFSRYLDAVATPEHPLVLFLDDLQWLDPASLELLEQLVRQPEDRSLLLLGAYREDEVDAVHRLRTTLDSFRTAGVPMQELALAPLAAETLVSLLSDMLRSPQERIEPLARLVREKTDGNPFFALQFLTALHEERLLWFAPETSSWTFDLPRIHAQAYTDNVIDLLAGRIHRLSTACRRTLQILACLGTRAKSEVLLRMLADPELPHATRSLDAGLQTPLKEAETAGLLVRHGDNHAFVHDRIRETAYASIAAPERSTTHLCLGRQLLGNRTDDEVGDEVFELVNQFNRALEIVDDEAERVCVRRLNLRAGRRSRLNGAFAAAREYLAQARALFPTDTWRTDYAETFATVLELAECEYLVGRYEQADSLFQTILHEARNDLERAKVLGRRVRLYDTSGRHHDALTTGLETLRLLGFSVPESAEAIGEAVEREQARVPVLLGERRIADLALAPVVSDPHVLASLDVLADLVSPAYLVRPELFPWIALHGLNLSLEHGNTASSCFAYSVYAVLLVAQRDVQRAVAFSDLALALNDRFRDVTRKGAILTGHGAVVSLWARPLSMCKAILEQGVEAAFQAGDYPSALSNATMAVLTDVDSAESVEVGRNTSAKYRAFADRIQSDLHSRVLGLCERHFVRLQGQHPRSPASEDDDVEERAAVDALRRANFEMGLFTHHSLKLIFAYTFGHFTQALEHADAAWALRGKRPLMFLYDVGLVFFHALTLTALSSQVSPERKAEFAPRLEEFLRELEYWADQCPKNFLGRYALVAAEMRRLEARDLDAMKAYAEAISAARENGFVFLESLACELAGRFYLDRGLEKNGYAHLRDARAGFLGFGAHQKVAQLDGIYPEVEKPAAPGPTATLGASLTQFDFANVVKASQAVSGEIETEKLVAKLMGLVMDHAGADRGLLLVPGANGFLVEAEATLGRDGLGIRQPRTSLSPEQIADGVFRYVVRTRERVILEDASARGLFTRDPYVEKRQSKSILGLPLLGQSRLLGVLYLENNLAPGVFTQDRVVALEVLASQAAISLQNARLFAELEQERSRLQASEERFSKAFKSNPTPMAVIGIEHRTFLDGNERFFRLLGYSARELCGHPAAELGSWFVGFLDEASKRLAAGGLFRDEEFSGRTKSGEPKALLASIEPMMLGGTNCYLATIVDLTERKQVEEQLRQSQKMEAIGSLAGGVAHDFNNLLTAINGYSELAMIRMEPTSQEYEHLKAIRSSGEQAASLTRQLLAFSRKETTGTEIQSLNAIVADTEGMLRRLIEENVEITTRLEPEAGDVDVDKGQVVQILMNLVVNARDAMPEGGRILVETRRVRLDKSTRDTLLEAPPGGYVALMVKDTGTGMTPEVKAKIFEPFFTTKPVGEGTGLGLAVVYGVVKQLGGSIALHTRPGEGSTFWIYFPEARLGAPAAAPETKAPKKSEAPRGSEIILIVEDDELVRRFIKRALTAQGYEVLEASNGVEALRLLDRTEQPLDLVVTDLMMPNMGGRVLAAHLRARRPALPVLYTSGYSKDVGDSHEALENAEYFLSKPFGPLDLARKVREVLKHSGNKS